MANPGVGFCPVPHVDHCLDVLLGDSGETDNEAVERLVELEVHLLCALQLHNEDRVVVRLEMFVSLVLLVWVLVREVDDVPSKPFCLQKSWLPKQAVIHTESLPVLRLDESHTFFFNSDACPDKIGSIFLLGGNL